jgi:hypothetical protein
MYLLHLFLFVTAVLSTRRRKNVALVSRHRQSQQASSEVVPTPSATLPKLDNLETTIRKWPEGGIGGNIETPAGGGSAVSELNANLRELSNWSNDGMAKLMGASGSQEVSISVLRSQFDQFRNDTRRSLSRITDALQNMGADTAEGASQSANSVQGKLKTIETQLDTLTSTSKSVSSLNSQLTTAQEAIVRMNERVVAIEDFTGITAAASGVQSAESSAFDPAYLGFDFLIKSWTGRFAMLGVALGLIGLILGVVALVMIPKKPAEPKGEEQVLLAAGGEDPNAAVEEGAAGNAEGYDPNAEQYYYQEGGEQQQEEVPAT